MSGEEAAPAAPPGGPAPGPAAGFETRRLGKNALIYLVPNLLIRGLTLLLTPLYTRRIDPAGFAIVGVAGSLTSVLSIVLGLGLQGYVTRLYVEYEPARRREVMGTVLATSVCAASLLVSILYAFGLTGHLEVFSNLRFTPDLQLILWTGFFSVITPLPVAYYSAAEQPRKVVALGILAAAVQIAFTVWLVVGLGQGARGVLRANLVASGATSVVALVATLRHSAIRLGLPGAREALGFSLPLVPHLVGTWVLSISDRLVLDKLVAPADVGRYSLAYMLSLMVTMIANSVGQAFVPMALRRLKSGESGEGVPRLGTYAVVVIVAAALAIALGAPEALRILAPPSYAGALVYVPWVVLGAVFQGMYLITSVGTWFSMRTKMIPLITLISAGANVGINLLLVPRYGAVVAALSTAGCYALSAILHGVLAHHLHPIAWEYRHWASLLGVAAAWYTLGSWLPNLPFALAVLLKGAVVLVAFPATLALVGFFRADELRRLRTLVVGA